MPELIKPLRVRSHGNLRFFRAPGGRQVIILPTCEVPFEHLIEENWAPINPPYDRNVGHVRKVEYVKKLANGEKIRDVRGQEIGLYVKSPEYSFSTNKKELEKGQIFGEGGAIDPWIGLRHSSVEKQVDWEARILLRLTGVGLKAEIPQAILIDRDGRKRVVTKEIKTPPTLTSMEHNGLTYKEIRERAEAAGLKPDDADNHNFLQSDSDGTHHVIDVSRWTWPPFTDSYRKKLIEAIQKEIEKRDKKIT